MRRGEFVGTQDVPHFEEHWTGATGVEKPKLPIADLPDIESFANQKITWICDNLIADSTVTMFSGESGCGKSTIASALAGCVSTGQLFAGRETQRRPVLILDCENPAPVVCERFARLGVKSSPMLKVAGVWLDEPPIPWGPTVIEWVKAVDPKPLLIVDSLVGFHPGEENSASETRKYMNRYRELAGLGATVLLIHHTGKAETAKEYRGSSDIKASLDAAYLVKNLGDPSRLGLLKISAFKTRFTAITQLVLQYRDGQFIADEGGPPTVTRELIALLKKNSGLTQDDFKRLAVSHDVGRNRARAFLLDGVDQGTIKCDREGNVHHYSWIGAEEDEDADLW